MKTESKLKHYRHPRGCKANCNWPACTQSGCVDQDAPRGQFYKSMGELFLGFLAGTLILLAVITIAIKAFIS
jgi:hypothetical protein